MPTYEKVDSCQVVERVITVDDPKAQQTQLYEDYVNRGVGGWCRLGDPAAPAPAPVVASPAPHPPAKPAAARAEKKD
ncbi:hypothetical protein M8C13_04530 [Crossiella sp. SN42]|uniref:hypothetical protein n=1 Tax=Crossiella sp. SN42 TaxID=2944808 RepID=UPI00207D5A3D|nr:hypothetical protein [Crossiella sp. SN42]MCO1575025.1 hypothetical protein [Crossiella sp. SN42]